MLIRYDILLTLTLTHDYYVLTHNDQIEKVYDGFELVPTQETSDLMRSMRMIAKRISNNWFLFFQAEGPFQVSFDSLIGKEFLFTLNITEPAFFSVTSDQYLNAMDEMIYFNSPINSVMIPDKRKVYGLQFNYTIHRQARPVNVRVTTAKGTEIHNNTINDPKQVTDEINLHTTGENIYNILEDMVPPGSLMTEKIYAREITDDGSFYGSVYFKVLQPDPVNHANEYEINFKKKDIHNN